MWPMSSSPAMAARRSACWSSRRRRPRAAAPSSGPSARRPARAAGRRAAALRRRRRALILDEPPSVDAGEITDKELHQPARGAGAARRAVERLGAAGRTCCARNPVTGGTTRIQDCDSMREANPAASRAVSMSMPDLADERLPRHRGGAAASARCPAHRRCDAGGPDAPGDAAAARAAATAPAAVGAAAPGRPRCCWPCLWPTAVCRRSLLERHCRACAPDDQCQPLSSARFSEPASAPARGWPARCRARRSR